SPAVADGRVYVESVGDRMVALDATGHTNCAGSPVQCNPLWTHKFGPDQDNSPTVVNGTIYVNDTDAWVYAIDGATGQDNWLSQYVGADSWGPDNWSSPAVANGMVYAVIPEILDGRALFAFDAAGCSATPNACPPKWIARYDDFGAGASPVVANGVVFVIDV